MTLVLPFVEQQDLFEKINRDTAWNAPGNESVFKTRINAFWNPGFAASTQYDQAGFALSHYAGNVHVLGGTRRLSLADFKDGTSNTILAGEIAEEFPPWGKPGNWRDPALGLNRRPDGFGGPFPGGANLLFADGSVRFIYNGVKPKVIQALATPSGGEVISPDRVLTVIEACAASGPASLIHDSSRHREPGLTTNCRRT